MSKNTTCNSYSAAGNNIAAICGLDDIDSMSGDEVAEVLGFEKPEKKPEKTKAQVEREETDLMMASIRSRLLEAKLPQDEMALIISAFGKEAHIEQGEMGSLDEFGQ